MLHLRASFKYMLTLFLKTFLYMLWTFKECHPPEGNRGQVNSSDLPMQQDKMVSASLNVGARSWMLLSGLRNSCDAISVALCEISLNGFAKARAQLTTWTWWEHPFPEKSHGRMLPKTERGKLGNRIILCHWTPSQRKVVGGLLHI